MESQAIPGRFTFVYRQVIDRATYQEQLDKLNEEITLAEMALNEATLTGLDVRAVLSFVENIVLNVARLWLEADIEQRQRLQRIVFPEGITYSAEGFGTAATSLVFRVSKQE